RAARVGFAAPFLFACAEPHPAAAVATPREAAPPRAFSATPAPLPDARGPAALDYLAVDRAAKRVYVPEGTTGSLDVFDIDARSFARVAGFATAEREVHGKMRKLGPSAVAIGDGVVYVGNRATSEVCVVDAKTLARGSCVTLPTATDGV